MVRARLALVRAEGTVSRALSDRDTSDAELATRLAGGDRAALDAIYARYAPELHGTLLRLLSRTGETEDVLQETFMTALRKVGQLRDKDALRSWLFRIAVREAHARLRLRRRWRLFGAKEEDDAPLSTMIAASASGDARAELVLLDRELAKLPPDHRIAWMLRYVEGEALEEVAAACGCSLATAKRRVAAADQAVRRHVKMEEASDE